MENVKILIVDFFNLKNLESRPTSIWNFFRVFAFKIAITFLIATFLRKPILEYLSFDRNIFPPIPRADVFVYPIATLIAATREEFAFRFMLTKNKLSMIVGGGFLVYYMMFRANNPNLIEILFVTIIAGIILKLNLKRNIKSGDLVLFSVFSSVLFALIHFNNFRGLFSSYDFWVASLIGILLILPQLIGGIFYSIIRIKYGFLWAILGHLAWNLYFIYAIRFRWFVDGLLFLSLSIFLHQIFLLFLRYKANRPTKNKTKIHLTSADYF